MSDTITITAGIDTAKHKLDVAIHQKAAPLVVDNNPKGWKRLGKHLTAHGVGRVGIEATGGYERGVVNYLRDAGFLVLRLQPLQSKAFARLHLKRAKNDRIDAALIAACAAMVEPPSVAADARIERLADHLTFIEHLEEDIARQKTRLEHIAEPRHRRFVNRALQQLDKQRDAEIAQLIKLLRAHEDLGRRFDLVLSIPGIGDRTALAIVLRMPELGQVSREQAAALAGLAPYDNDSGTKTGARHIAGGRGRLRRSLYAAALPAAFHWNPALKELYRRLIGKGASHKTALIACARKLLIYANTVVHRGTPWVTASRGTA
jgi:transposase